MSVREHGASTASELARELSTHTGATSYHLRALEDAGLVRDTGTGTGRRRVWEATVDLTWAPGELDDSDDRSADEWLDHDYLRHFATRYEAWLAARSGWPGSWQEALRPRDAPLLLTAEQAESFAVEVAEVASRYRRLGQGNPDARRVAGYVFTMPVEVDRPPSGA